MKKIFLSLILMSGFLLPTLSQSRIYISTELQPFVQLFVDEGLKRNLKLIDPLMDRVDTIFLTNFIRPPQLGACHLPKKTIYIPRYLLDHKVELRAAIFHELGHVITKSTRHTTKDVSLIMSEITFNALDIFENNRKWQRELNKYYKYINRKL